MTELISTPPDTNRHILLIDEQYQAAQEIAVQLALFGYTVTVRHTIDHLDTLIADIRPIALLIDMQATEMLLQYTAAVSYTHLTLPTNREV